MWYVGDSESGFTLDKEDSDFYEPIYKEVKSRLPSSREHFELKCKDKNRGVALFGTVPPPKKIAMDQVALFANAVAHSIQSLEVDAFQVYDIVEEKSRNGQERPFPFFETHDPREYSRMLEGMLPHVEPIIYKALVSGQSVDQWKEWLHETMNQYKNKTLVVVGGCRQPNETILTVTDAVGCIVSLKDQHPQISLGGITLPERHRDKGDEPKRIHEKVETGVSFFTSQVVYCADNAISLIRDYDEYCKANNAEPARIIFTFAPFGSENTVYFLRWLGVEVPEGTVRRVLSRPSLKQRVEESIEICYECWCRILNYCRRQKISVPIGFSVEAVSKSKAEQEAALQLFGMLKQEMQTYYARK